MRRVLVLFSTAILLYLSASYWYLPGSPYPEYSLQNFSSYVIRSVSGINRVFNGVENFFCGISYWFMSRRNLHERLNNLEKIESELNQNKIDLLSSQKIISQLSELVNVKFPDDYKKVTIKVFGAPLGFYNSQITAGVSSGVALQKDDVAISDKGVVGRIIEKSNRMVRIMLITDMASRLPVKILETGENCIAVGSGAAVMTLEHLQSKEIQTDSYKRTPIVGDVIVTSGIGGIFPPDLPVGTIVSISENEEITVKPFVIFHALEAVTILYDHD